jgi:hypothetical protein
MSDTKCVYRKTKTGEWVVMGPTDAVRAGEDCTVTRKNGETKTEFVVRVSKPFDVDGTECVYGFITDKEPATPKEQQPETVAVPVELVRQLAALLPQ